jgi:hypothetical protein
VTERQEDLVVIRRLVEAGTLQGAVIIGVSPPAALSGWSQQ